MRKDVSVNKQRSMSKHEYHFSDSRSYRIRSHTFAQAGSVSLEFVVLLPLLMVLLTGIVDLSLMIYDKVALATTARVAARAATVNSNIQAAITNVNASVVGFGPYKPQISGPSPMCSSAPSGAPTTVTIDYIYQGLLVGSAFSALTGPVTLKESAVMKCE